MADHTQALAEGTSLTGVPVDVACLGGLPATLPDGSCTMTVPGRLFRSPVHPLLTAGAGEALAAAGVTTVVDLRGADEGAQYVLPGTIRVQRAPVEDPADGDFQRAFGRDLGSPRYYPEVLRRWPDLLAAAIAAVARAPRGGVLVHCAAGRDRTGQVVAMLLTLAGVAPEVIARQDEQARRRANDYLRTHPRPQEDALDDVAMAENVMRSREELLTFLGGADLAAALVGAGLTRSDLAAVRHRLLVG